MDIKAMLKDKKMLVVVGAGALAGVVMLAKRSGSSSSGSSSGTSSGTNSGTNSTYDSTGSDIYNAIEGNVSSALSGYASQISDTSTQLEKLSKAHQALKGSYITLKGQVGAEKKKESNLQNQINALKKKLAKKKK